MSTTVAGSTEASGKKPKIKLVVAGTYDKARQAMAARGIAPGSAVVVIDLEGALRLGKATFAADEVLWESIPHSFSKVVIRLVRDHID